MHQPWRAQLDLEFARRADQTIMVRNWHEGPLQVQKALYPERRDVCHIAVLHPPGGIAAGDTLAVRSTLGAGTRVLLTTPGAARWYRADGGEQGGEQRGDRDDDNVGNRGNSAGNGAEQNLYFSVGRDAVLESLPRENIFFRGSDISMNLEVALAGSAKYLGWEIFSFGRRARGEPWDKGRLRLRTCVRRDERLLWLETAHIDARSGFAASVVGLAGATVSGTFLVASGEIDDTVLKNCRDVDASLAQGRIGVTRVPGVLIARYLGDSTQDAFRWFTRLWGVLRPAMLGREHCSPRVWAC